MPDVDIPEPKDVEAGGAEPLLDDVTSISNCRWYGVVLVCKERPIIGGFLLMYMGKVEEAGGYKNDKPDKDHKKQEVRTVGECL